MNCLGQRLTFASSGARGEWQRPWTASSDFHRSDRHIHSHWQEQALMDWKSFPWVVGTSSLGPVFSSRMAALTSWVHSAPHCSPLTLWRGESGTDAPGLAMELCRANPMLSWKLCNTKLYLKGQGCSLFTESQPSVCETLGWITSLIGLGAF